MLRLLSDENLNGDIVRGLLLRRPDLHLIRVQDVSLIGAKDSEILAWSAINNYIVLTHDRASMPDFAYMRIVNESDMPGLFVINDRLSVRQVIDEILFVDEFSDQKDWVNLVLYFPL